jgi:hypothetical protein
VVCFHLSSKGITDGLLERFFFRNALDDDDAGREEA